MTETKVKIVNPEDYNDAFLNEDNSFLLDDTIASCKVLNINPVICEVYVLEDDMEKRKEVLKDIIERHEGAVIITSTYVSKTKFPPDKYTIHKNEADKNKNLTFIDYNDIVAELDSQRKPMEELGFVGTNFYTQYSYKESWIYPNKYGQMIIDHWKEK